MINTQENSNNAEWTEVIGPKKGLFDINLMELWRYRDLILLFVKRDLLAQYKQTILGPLWFFIQPLFTTLIFMFVFNRIARIPTDNVNPILFYLSGITLWNYFADCFNKTSNTFVANAGVFGKVYFPRLASPVSIVISNLAKLAIQVVLFLVVMSYLIFTQGLSIHINLSILLLPYLIFIMAVLGLGAGIIFSSLTTKYRDLSFLLQFGIQLMMYATPIIYPLSFTQGNMRTLISLNPITSIIETFRYSFFGIGQFDLMPLLYTSIFSFIVLGLGIIIFNQVEKSFMDTV